MRPEDARGSDIFVDVWSGGRGGAEEEWWGWGFVVGILSVIGWMKIWCES